MSETYRIVKPKVLCREHVLLRGTEPVGRFTFDSIFSSSAHATAGEHHWTFTRAGMLKPVVTVRQNGGAVLTGRMRGDGSCDVEVKSGKEYRWKSMNVWRREFAWLRDNGTPFIRYRKQDVNIAAGDLPAETAHMLALLGAYLRVLEDNDAVAILVAMTG